MLVRILPGQVGQARENTWVMLVGNDTRGRSTGTHEKGGLIKPPI